jgi:hypothetical protein
MPGTDLGRGTDRHHRAHHDTTRRGTAVAGKNPVRTMPPGTPSPLRVRGTLLRIPDLLVPTRAHQSGGTPIHAAPTRRAHPPRPPPTTPQAACAAAGFVEPAQDTGPPLRPPGCCAPHYARRAFGAPWTPEPPRPLGRNQGQAQPAHPMRGHHKTSHPKNPNPANTSWHRHLTGPFHISSRHRSACGGGLGHGLSGVRTRFRTGVRLHYRGCGMDERLRRVLRERVEAYLRDVEAMLRGPAPAAAWPAVRVRLLPLASGWRSLLAQHGAGLRGRCRHCDRSFRPVRHRRPLCSVWRAAHAHLIGGWPSGGGE